MSQFRNIRLSGVDDSGTYRLYATWVVSVGAVTGGSFIFNEDVSWDSSAGAGKFWKEVNGLLYFDRRSGVVPEVGDTVTGGNSGATTTILSIDTLDPEGLDQNPPGFLTSSTQGPVAAGDSVQIDDGTSGAQTIKILTIPEEDQITVDIDISTVSWAKAWITRDRTPNLGLPLPRPGNARTANEIAEAFGLLDGLRVVSDWKDVATDSTAGYGSDWTDVVSAGLRWRTEPVKLSDGTSFSFVQMSGACNFNDGATNLPAANTLIFTLPSADAPDQLVRFVTTDGYTIEVQTDGEVRVHTVGDADPNIFFDLVRYPTA